MTKAIIKTENGITSITCMRGPISKMNSIVKDKLGNEWYCKSNRNDFKKLSETYHLEVFNSKGQLEKKFLNGFLTFVREIGESEPEILDQTIDTVKKVKLAKVKVISEPVDDMDYEQPVSDSEEE